MVSADRSQEEGDPFIKHLCLCLGNVRFQPEKIFRDVRFWTNLESLIGIVDTARLNDLMCHENTFELAWWLIRLSVERAEGKGRDTSI